MSQNDTAEAVNRSELHWDPKIGFELDVDVTAGPVAIRMVRVPVPADGTKRLRESPVELYALDTLFKSHVDVAGAPGQVNEVKVQLDGEQLSLTAVVEDAETGETSPLDVKLPLQMADDAPDTGGPMPKPPDEDDLDWEDEETFDRLFEGSPEATASEPPAGDDDTDEAEPARGGLSALLKALMSEDLDAGLEEPEPKTPTKAEPRPEPPPPPPPQPAAGGSMLMDSNAEARAFLQLLVDQEHLELVEDASADTLVAGTVELLAKQIGPEAKASALADWLMEREEVEELYIDDESLAALLDQW